MAFVASFSRTFRFFFGCQCHVVVGVGVGIAQNSKSAIEILSEQSIGIAIAIILSGNAHYLNCPTPNKMLHNYGSKCIKQMEHMSVNCHGFPGRADSSLLCSGLGPESRE